VDRFLKSPKMKAVPDRVAVIQIGLAVGVGVALWPLLGLVAATSAVLAGGISALSTWYTGRKVFGSRATDAQQFVRNLYLAHVMKIALVVALFCIVFATAPINFPVFVSTYTATLAVYAWALALLMGTSKNALRGIFRDGNEKV